MDGALTETVPTLGRVPSIRDTTELGPARCLCQAPWEGRVRGANGLSAPPGLRADNGARLQPRNQKSVCSEVLLTAG